MKKFEKLILYVISFCFIIWSVVFIYQSSFIAVDGNRYFCLFDDAMISMRYAWNFSHGLGLVWNQGEYIQGYTNLLMTILMSLFTFMYSKSIAALLIQISGAGFMLAIAYVTMKIFNQVIYANNYQHKATIRVLSFFGVLSYYPLVYWSLMGMETGLLTLLLLIGIFFALEYTKSCSNSHLYMVSIFLGLAYLTRNDSIIFAALVGGYIVWNIFIQTGQTRRHSLWQFSKAINLYLVFVAGQSIFQYTYYGEILPNTYTLKLTGMPLLLRLSNGIGFITPFLTVTGLILALSIIESIIHFQKRKLLFVSIAVSAIGYQIYVGGDPWNYWRMMSPSMPLLIILFTVAINSIMLTVSKTYAVSIFFQKHRFFPKQFLYNFLLLLPILFGFLLSNVHFLPEAFFSKKPYLTFSNKNNVNIAITLNQLTTNEATVGVFFAGAIPYYTDRKAIDFLGKSDRYIANLPPDVSGLVQWKGMKSVPGHNKYDLNYSIKSLQPTYVQFFFWGGQNLSQWAASNYVNVIYNNVSLSFLKDSPAVLWDKINALQSKNK